ncbi:MAG: VanZ family protein [Dissulfurispiraceae bacterium]|jgi:VanZ family protein|nr:VanZ family protein [Dissulfurispiraceae bacterium]
MLVLLGFSSIPGRDYPDMEHYRGLLFFMGPEISKVLHVIAFAVLSYLAVNVFLKKTQKAFVMALIFSIGYGVFIEIWQSFIPMRTPSCFDILFDSGGAVIGLAAYSITRRERTDEE